MKAVTLPNSSKILSQIGFGCAYVVSGPEAKSSIRALEAAIEAGLRHFDVAPSYGMGTAEDVVGTALRRVRSEVSIASKAGLSRPRGGSCFIALRTVAGPMRRMFPRITRGIGAEIAGRATGRRFSVESIEHSLTETLRRLRTDYLDLFLLHEAGLNDISDEVLTFIDKRRKEGVVRALGIASSFEPGAEILRQHPSVFDVVQYSWNVLNGKLLDPVNGAFIVTHRAILGAFEPLRAWLQNDQSMASRLSVITGVDLSQDGILADVLLGAALSANESGIVLAASRRVDRIRHFGEIVRNPSIRKAGSKLTAALFQERTESNSHSRFQQLLTGIASERT
jgi:D-threo-aldose 1-dehydrogenase